MPCEIRPMEINIDNTNGEIRTVPSPNFNYNKIPENHFLKINRHQQMLVKSEIIISGELKIEGELCLF